MSDPFVAGTVKTPIDNINYLKKGIDLNRRYKFHTSTPEETASKTIAFRSCFTDKEYTRITTDADTAMRFFVTMHFSICMVDYMQAALASKEIKALSYVKGIYCTPAIVLNKVFGMTVRQFNYMVAMKNAMVDAGYLVAPDVYAIPDVAPDRWNMARHILHPMVFDSSRFACFMYSYVAAMYKKFEVLNKKAIMDRISGSLLKQIEEAEMEEMLMPEDEWYPDRDDYEKEPDFSDVPENDGSCHAHVKYTARTTKSENDTEVRVVQELPNKERLVEIHTPKGIKYIIIGEDVDVLRLPKIYKLIRNELKMGRNVTTDRLSRVQKLDEILDMGFTKAEAAQLMDVPIHIVNSDYRILKEIQALNE